MALYVFSISSEIEKLLRVTNHPVHIVDQDQKLSPTALIPFCEFSGDMSVMGVKIDQFDVPVCNSFRPKIVKNQLCYEVDPNKYQKYLNEDSKLTLKLFIDQKEDREIDIDGETEKGRHQKEIFCIFMT